MTKMYLYNGYEFPELPIEPISDYSYWFIQLRSSTATTRKYRLVNTQCTLYKTDSGEWPYKFTDPNQIKYDWYFIEDGVWKYAGNGARAQPSSYTYYDLGDEPISWSNFNILNESGSIHLAASDPVPVGGEPETPDTVLTLTASDLYKKVNGQLVKHTLYKKVGGKLVKYDEYAMMMKAVEEDTGVELPAVGTSLEDCTWEQISAISAAGKAAEYFSVGDTKSVYLKGTVGTLELDTTLYVYILGFDHNSEIEGKGITFGTFKTADGVDVALCDSKYDSTDTSGAKYFNMNHWGGYNYGGWAGSDLRYDILGSTDVAPSGYGAAKTTSVVGYDATATCATNPVANTLMAALPADLRAVMKPMTKYSNNTGNSGDTEAKVTVTTDYLPLLAEFEIFGARTFANSYEQNKQKQYDYFAAGNSKKKYLHSSTGSTADWWERSAVYGTSDHFCIGYMTGGANLTVADYAIGVAPIFLV